MATIAESFDEHWLEDAAGCWIWQRYCDKDGYGTLWVKSKTVRAHRFSYAREHGVLLKSVLLRHQCHNTSCVNPAHLLPGDNLQNAQDRVQAGRQCSKLDVATVIQMRFLLTWGWSRMQLAVYYGVNWSTANRAAKGETWSHV